MANFRVRWIDRFSVSDPCQATARLRIIHARIKNRERYLVVAFDIASVLSDFTDEYGRLTIVVEYIWRD